MVEWNNGISWHFCFGCIDLSTFDLGGRLDWIIRIFTVFSTAKTISFEKDFVIANGTRLTAFDVLKSQGSGLYFFGWQPDIYGAF